MYTVYRITNTINNRYYIGVHKTNNKYDNYMGSGLAIKRAIDLYGVKNFTKEILYSFNCKDDAYDKEKQLIGECINDPLSYNISHGGEGGWDYFNKKRRHDYTNPMKNEQIVKKNLESRKKNETPESIQRKIDTGRVNIKKAIRHNTGRKRPKQSQIMKEKSSFNNMWKDKEKMRDLLSSWFAVVSPDGTSYNTNRLQDFCKLHDLQFVSVWNTSRTGKTVSKGKSKGWKCTIIQN